MNKTNLIIFFTLICSIVQANENKLIEISQTTKWQRLIHYVQENGKLESQLDGSEFFFSKNGKFDPLKELKASIKGFASNKKIGRLKLHPQCAFPERFRYLKEALNLKYEEVPCPKFESFLKDFHNPTSVSLVFSSAYPNNPASMFGHTFLKIRSNRKNHLLDKGINFAAWTPTNYNMLAFMYKGVVGGYPGLWSIEPYYKKVNEYINSESRDLWEYELSLSQEETKRLLGHLWELEVTSYFDYYFFDENCSYQVLKAIEAIRTDWYLTEHRIYVIPGETIKRVFEQNGAIKSINFRPSLYHQAQIKLAALNETKQESAYQWINRQENAEISYDVLDAALTGLLYYKAKKKKKWNEADQAWENKLLSLQSNNKKTQTEMEIPKHLLESRSDYGHDPYSFHTSVVNLSGKNENQKRTSLRLKIRSAYHDLLARDKGYSPFSEIEFPWIEFDYNDLSSKFQLQELGGFNTISLFPISKLDKRKSWKLKIGLFREALSPCYNCLMSQVEGGMGASIGGLTNRFYLMAVARAQFHNDLDYGYRVKPGAEAGAVLKPFENYKFGFSIRELSDLHGGIWQREYEFHQAFHLNRNLEIRQSLLTAQSFGAEKDFNRQVSIEFRKYFR